MKEEKLNHLLSVVIENYIDKGDPIGSKFLHSLESTDYAPSTLRKYLNILEKEGLLYQPYNSAGRIPTVKGLSSYIDNILSLPDDEEYYNEDVQFDVADARKNLHGAVKTLGDYVDGAVVGFLGGDEYYYLGINNLLRESLISDHETTRFLVEFIESKELVQQLDGKLIKKGKVYYTFLENKDKHIAVVYTKIDIKGYDAILSILGPSRVDHKKNIILLKKFLEVYRG